MADLERRLPGSTSTLRLHVTGCPNSCGQHWIADLGIEGKKIKVDGQMADAYYFCVGGGVGRRQATARPVGYRIAADGVPAAVERLLRAYLAERRPGDTFHSSPAHGRRAARRRPGESPAAVAARSLRHAGG